MRIVNTACESECMIMTIIRYNLYLLWYVATYSPPRKYKWVSQSGCDTHTHTRTHTNNTHTHTEEATYSIMYRAVPMLARVLEGQKFKIT